MQAEIAFILKGYPRLSETFIANEIRLLEEMGLAIAIYSVKRPEESQVHGMVEKIRARVHYLPGVTSLSNTRLLPWVTANLPTFYRSHWWVCKRRPLAYCAILLKALGMCVRYRSDWSSKPKKVFIKEFLQAGYIASQVLRSGQIRHLHAHFCHGATTIAMMVSDLTDIPFSFTAHAKDIYQKSLNPGALLQKKIARARFVATCTAANKVYLDLLAGPGKVHKIYHGLDVDCFKPAKPQIDLDRRKVQILSVGRFVEKKGFGYLLEACQALKQQGYAFHCRIIGEMGDQYTRLHALRSWLGLVDHVSFEEPMTQEALRVVYTQSDIFALPCQVLDDGDRDGIPNVMAEAMASGVAVVSTNISGIPELVESGVDGLLVEEKDTAALTAVLGRLIDDPTLRERLAHNARTKTCRVFDSKHTTLDLKQLFDQCTVGLRSAIAQ